MRASPTSVNGIWQTDSISVRNISVRSIMQPTRITGEMKRTSFARWPCSIARTVDLLGDWWTPLVLRECYLGTRRFEDFQRNLSIGRNVLTQRLNRLVDEALLERVPYQQGPVRNHYVLTPK